jgi:hypothetical protein
VSAAVVTAALVVEVAALTVTVHSLAWGNAARG